MIQNFLIRTLFIAAFFVVVIVLLNIIARLVIGNFAYCSLKPDARFIVLGHSHPQCAINDEVFTTAANFAASGEAYIYTKAKLSILANRSLHEKTLLLSFSLNQLSPEMDKWMREEQYYFRHFKTYAPFIEYKDLLFLVRQNPLAFFTANPLILKSAFTRIFLGKMDFLDVMGGFLSLHEIRQPKPVINENGRVSVEVSHTNLKYLSETIKIGNQADIPIYLIQTPVHESYSARSLKTTQMAVIDTLTGITGFLDFSDFALPESAFADDEHLNIEGANLFSLHLMDSLRNGDRTDLLGRID